MSLGYIQDTWIDPRGTLERKEAAKEAARLAMERENARNTPAKKGTNVVAGATGTNTAAAAGVTNAVDSAAGGESGKTSEATDDAAMMEARKDTQVVKELTAVAKTNEIPTSPEGMGISIEATNPR
jgi:hypothetical protein